MAWASRQWTVWIAFVCVVVASAAIFDGIEVRLYDSRTFYYRSDWGEVAGWPTRITTGVAYGGALAAGALVYGSIVLSAARRLRGSRWRFVAYTVGVPIGVLAAFGALLAIVGHPYLFYSERES